MNYRPILYFLFAALMVCTLSCKKSANISPSDNLYKMNGTWQWEGPGGDNWTQDMGDLFFQFKITVLNKKQIIGYSGDTLNYDSTNPTTHIITFKYRDYDDFKYNKEERITYNYAENTMTCYYGYSFGSSNGGFNVHSKGTVLTPTARQKARAITEIHSLSGYGYDTFVIRRPTIDSIYPVSSTFNAVFVDDSTISYSASFLTGNYDNLHFYAIDERTNTITFAAYHRMSDDVTTTLTYNYLNKSVVFKYRFAGYGRWISYILQ